IGPDEKLIEALNASPKDFQVIVITGINKLLFKKTKDIAARSAKRIIALGFVTNVHEIMGISDVIITKPGGLTTAEALAKSLPMIIINPLPGQEEFNTKMLTSGGMAIRATDESHAVRLLEDLLGNPAGMAKMQEVMKGYARPNSAADIAELLLNLAN
ncbi:MAG: glycosyltransferase, partial [Candidatus Omnitrophica bacterium]|nr:glycosyltransferase [Candidatus Omnitrophota bacterium]